MFRILHLADLHLGWQPRFMPEERAVERRRRRDSLLARAVDYALAPENRVGLVVIAGDLFETHRPEAELVQAVLAQLRRLESAGVPVVTVPGNHDEITYHDAVYRRYAGQWPGVLVQNPLPAHVATLDVGGHPVHLYSLAYTGGITPAHEPLRRFPRLEEPGFHLAAFHGTLGPWGGDRSLPLDREALGRAGYGYVALGHIHQALEDRPGGTPVVYAGAVEGKGFDDPGVGCWTVVEVEGERAVRVLRPPVPVQPVRTERIDAGAFEGVEELAAALAGRGDPDLILRVELEGVPAFQPDVERLVTLCGDRFFHLEIHDGTEVVPDHLLERWAAEPTILGQFVRRMRERLREAEEAGDPRQYRLAARALRLGVQALLRGGDT